MANKWKLSKKEVKEALISWSFGEPDNNIDYYDLHINKDGSIDLILNSKGHYHYNNPQEVNYN